MVLSDIDFLYRNFDDFKLLLECSEETKYSNYVEELVNVVVNDIGKLDDIILGKKVPIELLQILVSAYFSGFFEPLHCNMNYEEAQLYCVQFYKILKIGFTQMKIDVKEKI